MWVNYNENTRRMCAYKMIMCVHVCETKSGLWTSGNISSTLNDFWWQSALSFIPLLARDWVNQVIRLATGILLNKEKHAKRNFIRRNVLEPHLYNLEYLQRVDGGGAFKDRTRVVCVGGESAFNEISVNTCSLMVRIVRVGKNSTIANTSLP